MNTHGRTRDGITILEVLLVLVIVAIPAAVLLPDGPPSPDDRLRATSRVVLADLAYARSLAISEGRCYALTFEPLDNRYVIHPGPTTLDSRSVASSSSALSSISLLAEPSSRVVEPSDPCVVELNDLPCSEQCVRLVGTAIPRCRSSEGIVQAEGVLEFSPTGATTRKVITSIALTVGTGDSQRQVVIQVNPITGVAQAGPVSRLLAPRAETKK